MTPSVLLGVWLAAAGPSPAAELIGNWARRDGQTRIRIAPCGDALCAVNTWVREPAGDERVGDVLQLRLGQTAPTTLSGDAYDVRRDMTVSMEITLSGTSMRTSGCVMFVLCRSSDWVRVQ